MLPVRGGARSRMLVKDAPKVSAPSRGVLARVDTASI